ncbi:MAG TPA: CoA transferase [Dehalococcoidia bacterium]|jgi:crotonobetainyl-CoA:carnitine CoA-transferase CaiB-like acyl-CoA transferase|nr:CoA transferase [Dehalococcoidia bacterium]
MTEQNTPLAGLRVLDLGRYQAGPRCALMFARMGAEVIKVEALNGDESRRNGPTVRGQSAYWVQYNSGKKSLAINLRTDEGKEVLRDLVKVSDIFLQNFRPGTIDIMGFGYDVLKELNPKIIMINVSAYGQTGSMKDQVGFDPIGQAMGGLMSLTGTPDDAPMRTAFPLIDRITSLHATIGALAALRERDISGEGQTIDVCLADTGFTTNEIPISAYLGSGHVVQREGNGKGLGGTYQTKDGWIIIAANNDAMWGRMCEAVNKPEWLEDTRFSTRADRQANNDALEDELTEWFSERNTRDAAEHLSAHSVPCAPVNTVEQAAKEPLLQEREMMMEIPDPVAGTMWVTGKSIKFGRTPMVVNPTPLIGEHTRELLSDVLGYDDEKIGSLEDSQVIKTTESTPAAAD